MPNHLCASGLGHFGLSTTAKPLLNGYLITETKLLPSKMGHSIDLYSIYCQGPDMKTYNLHHLLVFFFLLLLTFIGKTLWKCLLLIKLKQLYMRF